MSLSMRPKRHGTQGEPRRADSFPWLPIVVASGAFGFLAGGGGRSGGSPRIASADWHDSRWESALSQSQMDEAAAADLADAEGRLEAILLRLRNLAAPNAIANPRAIELLDQSQRAWVAHRDSQIALEWPWWGREGFGSVLPMCISLRLAELTHDRARELRLILADSQDEGNVCLPTWPASNHGAAVPRR